MFEVWVYSRGSDPTKLKWIKALETEEELEKYLRYLKRHTNNYKVITI